ncbi:MAG: exporter of the superfamily protein-like protein [Myxococcales bacterium]|nr:exporter of the superfamily protein-like protein [Myxococcales bacterium]
MLSRLLHYRWVVIAVYALLVPAAAVLATRIPTEGAIANLIVPSDPDYAATRAFQAIFPEPQLALLVFESVDPWSAAQLARVDRAKAALAHVPHVGAFSVLDVLRRAQPGADPMRLRDLAVGTPFFRRQGLVGDDFLTLIASLDVHGAAERDATLAAIDHALAHADVGPVHKIGSPYVTSWLEHQSSTATSRSFAIFAVLLLAITFFLYRSVRAVLAIVIALGAAVALGIAAGAVLGFAFTIVAALVPLTIMVTTLATLTYLHSRFVDQPDGVSLEQHHIAALRNKLLPVTASTIAAATGFAALAVSNIRPIRQMGIWTAVGLLIAWVVAYTLFPALQAVLRTPTARKVPVRTIAYDRVARALPLITYRFRRPLVIGALALSVAGALAITGVPGVVSGMPVEVDALSNIDPSTALAHDLRWFRAHVMDLNIARVWIHLPNATATEPEVLRAIDQFEAALESATNVTGVAGPTTPLRMRSYLAGHGDALPRDPEPFAHAVADLEQLMLTEPELRTFIDVGGLSDLQITVQFRNGHAAGYAALVRRIQRAWEATRATSPALAGARMVVVGESLLQVKVGANLVPTLAESFLLTMVFIFAVFLVIFRSGKERLIAMIPSVFALLVTFLGLRLFGGALNVATIIIATTVLGTTENDQLHFFHHMHERAGAPLDERLRHALRVSGRAVLFATVINAVGFLGLAASHFPPLRQFGLMTAAAFVLAMIADFTVLPAALWIASRDRPEPSAR